MTSPPPIGPSARACYRCGYCLLGLGTGKVRCPECGTDNPAFERYTFRRRLFSWGYDYSIVDATRRERFLVRNIRLSLVRRAFTLRDPELNLLAEVREQPLAFSPTYHICRPGQPDAAIRQRRLSVRPQYNVFDIERPDERLSTIATPTGHRIVNDEDVQAMITRRQWTIWTMFDVDVDPRCDVVLLLAAAVVMETQ